MKTRPLHLGPLLAVLTSLAILAACTGDAPVVEGIPPCTPAEGSEVDPCAFRSWDCGSGFASGGYLDDEPRSMRSYLEGSSDITVSHMVIRGTYLPGTVRCAGNQQARTSPYAGLDGKAWGSLTCFVDVRVNQYIVGSGPSLLTIVYADAIGGQDPEELEKGARAWERVIANGGIAGRLEVEQGGIVGNEKIMLIGPGIGFNFEAMQVFSSWDVQRRDGRIVAIHPEADQWLWLDADRWRNQVELELPAMYSKVQAAHQEWVAETEGRIRVGSSYPLIVTDANRLHDYYVETGAVNHPDGPPALPPPAR